MRSDTWVSLTLTTRCRFSRADRSSLSWVVVTRWLPTNPTATAARAATRNPEMILILRVGFTPAPEGRYVRFPPGRAGVGLLELRDGILGRNDLVARVEGGAG